METSKKFFIFHKAETVKKLLIFPEMEHCLFKPRLKKLKKIHPEKIAYTLNIFSKESCSFISGNENPKKLLILSQKKAFLTF